MNLQEALNNCTVDAEAKTITIPTTPLERKVYTDLAKKLIDMGGKKMRGGALFQYGIDPTEKFNEVLGGKKVNLKKDFQFFATPPKLADKLVALAGANRYNTFLEPSAGQGAIVKAITRAIPGVAISCCELMPENREVLMQTQWDENKCNIAFIGEDFMTLSTNLKYDRIIANPPFTNNQDIDHVRKMFRHHLSSGGRLVSVMSTSWQTGKQKKQVEFREWLDDLGADVINLPAGTFKESGTDVPAVIVILDHA